jgi:low affinity Fe/Cu permease
MSENAGHRNGAELPSDEDEQLSVFDRFAIATSNWASRAWFFAACVLIVLVWVPTFALLPLDTWQLVINTLTTIITFLLVALLQNTEKRADDAVQQKLNAIAGALADLMQTETGSNRQLADDRRELLAAVGLEDRESAG